MRLRIVITTALTAAVFIAIALLWRQVFPFRDGLAEFLPEGTIAYVHVNLTPAIRSAIQAQLDSLPLATDAPEKHGRVFLEQALDALDVRELAFAWHQPEKLAPQLALIIEQRASERPDVMPTTTVSVGEQEIRTFVVRVQTSGWNSPLPPSFPLPSSGGEGEKLWRKLRRQPVQAILRPREFPISAIEAARHLLPETITASGTLNRHGFILHGDQSGDQKNAIAENWSPRIPLIARSARIALLAEPRPGTFQIIGLPVRAIAEQLELPFHGELRAAIEPFLPADADLLVDGNQIVARMDAPVLQPPEIVLRSLAARFWPIARPRLLDGLPASVLVADPDIFEIVQAGSSRWALQSKSGGASLVLAERSGDSVYLATDEKLLGLALPTPSPTSLKLRGTGRSPSGRGREGGGAGTRIPRSCRLGDQKPFIVFPIHPQAVVTVSVNRSGSNVAICVRIAHPEN